jgi:hypothetical protein
MKTSDSGERRNRIRDTQPSAIETRMNRSLAANRGLRAAATRHAPHRECIELRDLADCLLEAYDCVARRAYEKFLARGERPNGEVDDWVEAERELLPSIPVTVEDGEHFIYALAAVPRSTSRISVAVESRWLVVLSHVPADAHRDGFRAAAEDTAIWRTIWEEDAVTGPAPAEANQFRRRLAPPEGPRGRSVDCTSFENGHRRRACNSGNGSHEEAKAGSGHLPFYARGDGGVSSFANDVPPAQSVCVLELPAEVDAARSVAVRSKGLLGIRMPKIAS